MGDLCSDQMAVGDSRHSSPLGRDDPVGLCVGAGEFEIEGQVTGTAMLSMRTRTEDRPASESGAEPSLFATSICFCHIGTSAGTGAFRCTGLA